MNSRSTEHTKATMMVYDQPVVSVVVDGVYCDIAGEMRHDRFRVRSGAKRGKSLGNANPTAGAQRVLKKHRGMESLSFFKITSNEKDL